MSRINPGTMIVAIFAILFGLVGAYAVRRYMEKPPETVQAEPEPTPPQRVRVPLASSDIPVDRPLTLGDVAIFSLTQEQIAERKLPEEFMVNPQQIIGRILREPMNKGDAFQTEKFYPEGMGPSVADRLKAGLRAVTVAVEGTGVLEGLVGSSSKVDVLFRTLPDPENEVPATTVTLLEDVEVLAVDRNITPGVENDRSSDTVTLAVSLQQANALKIAEGRGEFSLALRNPSDDSLAVSTGPQTLEALMNLPRKRKPFKAEIYRGHSRSTLQFEREPLPPTFTIETPITGVRRSDSDQDSELVSTQEGNPTPDSGG